MAAVGISQRPSGVAEIRYHLHFSAWRPAPSCPGSAQHGRGGFCSVRFARSNPSLARVDLIRARLDSTRLGSARLGLARLGSARLGLARLCWFRLGSAPPGPARLGSARLGLDWLGPARPDAARLGRVGIRAELVCRIWSAWRSWPVGTVAASHHTTPRRATSRRTAPYRATLPDWRKDAIMLPRYLGSAWTPPPPHLNGRPMFNYAQSWPKVSGTTRYFRTAFT